MQKEVKGKKKVRIKKRIPEKNTNVNNKSAKVKRRVSPRSTKQDKEMRIACLAALILAIIVVYIVLGIEFAAIATVGSAFIIGLGLLLRKAKTTAKRRKLINGLIIFFLTLGILAIIALGAYI